MSQTPRPPHDPLDLNELPTLAEVFDRMSPGAVGRLKPLLRSLPLVNLLSRALAEADAAAVLQK